MATTGFRRNNSRKSTKLYRDPTVLWDVDDLLILNSLEPNLVYGNITSKLEDMGCGGYPFLTAFVDDNITPYLEDMYRSVGFTFSLVPNYGTKYARVHNMAVETLIWALEKQSIPSILIIFSKSMGEEKQLASLIEAIKKKVNYDIVILDPTSLLGKSVGIPVAETKREPIHRCERKKSLIKKGECIPNFTKPRLSSGVSNFLDSSVVEAMFNDLSHASKKFGREYINLYWYVEDSSILEKHDPILIYRNIKSGLSEKGYTGHMSIVAFVDYKSRLSEELSRDYMRNRICICPLPKGNRYAMLTEILLWAMIKHGLVSNLILLSTNFQKEKQVVSVLQALKERDDFNIVLQDLATLLEASVGNPLDQSRYAHKDHPFDQSNKKYCCECKKSLIKEGESSSQNQ